MSLETLFLIHFIELWPLNSAALMTCSWVLGWNQCLPGKQACYKEVRFHETAIDL